MVATSTDLVGLVEARRRVGTAIGVDPMWWWWRPEEVRWLAAQWRLTLPDHDGLPAVHRPSLAASMGWLLWRAPIPVRVAVTLACMFAYAFGAGWAR